MNRRWPMLVALASLAGVLLGGAAIALSVLSVSTSTSVAAVKPVAGATGTKAPGPSATTMAGGPASAVGTAAAKTTSAAGSGLSSGLERRAKGRPDAPVLIQEWFDFQCGSCGRFGLSVEPELERLYVETGKARIVARNFPFLGSESFLAAEAAEAAADQGRYWPFRAALFLRYQSQGRSAFRPDSMRQLAAEMGLDQRLFETTLDRGVHREAVLAERREAERLGINATPSFILNGRLLNGIPTVEMFGKLIEEELAKNR